MLLPVIKLDYVFLCGRKQHGILLASHFGRREPKIKIIFSVMNEEVHKEWQFCSTFSKQDKIPNASEIELSILMNKDMHCFLLVLQH